MPIRVLRPTFAVLLLAAALSACAAGPSDPSGASGGCTKADDAVGTLICEDPRLAELDREIDRLHELAVKGPHMDDARRAQLRAWRNGWNDRRDECVKSPDLSACVLEESMARIHFLRQGYSDARQADEAGISLGPQALACQGFGAGIGLTFADSDPSAAFLEWHDGRMALTRARSGSGARYTGKMLYEEGEGELWIKGDEAMLTLPGRPRMTCVIEEIG